jgi:hypothetical protein
VQKQQKVKTLERGLKGQNITSSIDLPSCVHPQSLKAIGAAFIGIRGAKVSSVVVEKPGAPQHMQIAADHVVIPGIYFFPDEHEGESITIYVRALGLTNHHAN